MGDLVGQKVSKRRKWLNGGGGDRPQAWRQGKGKKRPGAVVTVVAWGEAEAAGWRWWRQTQAKLKKRPR